MAESLTDHVGYIYGGYSCTCPCMTCVSVRSAVAQKQQQAPPTIPSVPPIPGVPLGCRLVRIGVAQINEWYINSYGLPQEASFTHSVKDSPIIEPANVYSVCHLTTVPILAGYERAGETIEEWFRVPNGGEPFLRSNGTVDICTATYNAFDQRRIILRKIAPKTKQVLVIEVEHPGSNTYLSKVYFTQSQLSANVSAKILDSRLETRPV